MRAAKFREYFAKRRVAHFHDEDDAPRYDDQSADAFTSGPLPPFRHTLSLELARRSLYVMREAIRWQWQHSMPPMRELRCSITRRTRATVGQAARYRAP